MPPDSHIASRSQDCRFVLSLCVCEPTRPLEPSHLLHQTGRHSQTAGRLLVQLLNLPEVQALTRVKALVCHCRSCLNAAAACCAPASSLCWSAQQLLRRRRGWVQRAALPGTSNGSISSPMRASSPSYRWAVCSAWHQIVALLNRSPCLLGLSHNCSYCDRQSAEPIYKFDAPFWF
jgi:hypothetical protein